MCTPAPQPTPEQQARQRASEEAAIVRELIQHEDNVLHTRLQWFGTLQGLLMAAAALLAKEPGVLRYAPLGLCVIGMVVAASTFHATRMATQTMIVLRRDFLARHQAYDGPPLIGKPADEWPLPWLRPSRALPVSISVLWLLFFVAWGAVLLYGPRR